MQMLRPTYSRVDGHGAMRCAPEGEAWRLQWTLGEASASSRQGVALIIGRAVFAARSADGSEVGFPPPGIVVYERDASGELPAQWYHPDLQGRPGEGRSLEGPAEGYVGTYRAEYASREGAFDPLVKEISRQGAAYRFAWRTARETIYSGIGIEHGPKLVAAWSSPQDSLEVAIYELASDFR